MINPYDVLIDKFHMSDTAEFEIYLNISWFISIDKISENLFLHVNFEEFVNWR